MSPEEIVHVCFFYQGNTEQHQISLISQLCGSLTPEAWPGVEKLELYCKLTLPKGQKRKVKERLKVGALASLWHTRKAGTAAEVVPAVSEQKHSNCLPFRVPPLAPAQNHGLRTAGEPLRNGDRLPFAAGARCAAPRLSLPRTRHRRSCVA